MSKKPKTGYKIVKLLFKKYEEIPNEWEIVKGEKAFKLSSGVSPSEISFSRDSSGDTLFVQVDDMNLPENQKEIINSRLKFYQKENQEAPFEENKTLVFPKRGAAILTGKVRILAKNSTLDPNVMALKCKNSLDPYFMYYFLSKLKLRFLMENAGIPQLNNKDLYPRNFVRPQISEQQKIVSILSDVDSLIQQTQKIIEQTQMLKKGLMQKLLTKGIGHTKFKKVKWLFGKEIEIPEEWEIEKLKGITHKIGDGIHSTPDYVDDSDYYFINGNNLVEGKVVFFDNTKNVSEGEFRKYKLDLNMDTVFLSINGTIGNVAFYNNEKIVLGKSVSYIICNEKLNQKFLFYVLQSKYLKKFFGREQTSTTIFNLSLSTVRNSPILLPDIKQQQKIASILSNVDSRINELKLYKSSLESLKEGLMQKLLTGQIRV